jgi:antitoxin component YwqK of YwqJK toxin-antitoxin module
MNRSNLLPFLLMLFPPLFSFSSKTAPGTSGFRGFIDLDTLPTKGVYSGRIRTDSVFYNNQLSFINRDTALFFLDDGPSRLREIPCATYYRVAPLNKYYQQNGLVADYYLDNDSAAARLAYQEGVLDGRCVFYYRNGQIREKGAYTKNTRTGTWEYYYENGQKAKTVRITDTGVYLIDCFSETGEILAHDGNGRFEGTVLRGTSAHPTELKMSGPVKDGVPDGEWNIYDRFLSHPLAVEHFSSGRFLDGISTSVTGTQKYNRNFLGSVESVHAVEALDQYGYNDFCLTAGKSQSMVAPTPGRLTLNGKSRPYERFYVVLVEANTVVIPEEILYKRLQAFLFGSN